MYVYIQVLFLVCVCFSADLVCMIEVCVTETVMSLLSLYWRISVHFAHKLSLRFAGSVIIILSVLGPVIKPISCTWCVSDNAGSDRREPEGTLRSPETWSHFWPAPHPPWRGSSPRTRSQRWKEANVQCVYVANVQCAYVANVQCVSSWMLFWSMKCRRWREEK